MKAKNNVNFKPTIFHKWMKQASTAEQQRLAELSGVNWRFLYHISSGSRNASSTMAAIIEDAAKIVRADNNKLPVIKRYDISPECSSCPYALRCKPQNPKTPKA